MSPGERDNQIEHPLTQFKPQFLGRDHFRHNEFGYVPPNLGRDPRSVPFPHFRADPKINRDSRSNIQVRNANAAPPATTATRCEAPPPTVRDVPVHCRTRKITSAPAASSITSPKGRRRMRAITCARSVPKDIRAIAAICK